MVSSCLYRGLKIIAALAPIALLPAGCADPCQECPKIDCSHNDIDCSPNAMKCGDSTQSSKAACENKIAQCEAKKKETVTGCEQIKTMCFKSCKAPPPQ
jgi:hypothetical protein